MTWLLCEVQCIAQRLIVAWLRNGAMLWACSCYGWAKKTKSPTLYGAQFRIIEELYNRILLIAASKLLNCGIQVTESWQSNYWIVASEFLNHGIQTTENCHHLLTTCEAEARQMRSMANNLGTTSDSWEHQVEAGAFGMPQDLEKLRGHAR